MNRSRFFSLLLLVIATTSLTACDNARRSLGLERTAPDEFRVISRAPLTVPPDFNLRPPNEAAAIGRSLDADTREKAREALLGNTGSQVMASSPAENLLLTKAGVDKSNPNIKGLIDKETAQLIEDNKGLFDNITSYKRNPTEVLVDAEKEKERLEKNKTEGKPANSGAVPTIKQRRKGLLEGVF